MYGNLPVCSFVRSEGDINKISVMLANFRLARARLAQAEKDIEAPLLDWSTGDGSGIQLMACCSDARNEGFS